MGVGHECPRCKGRFDCAKDECEGGVALCGGCWDEVSVEFPPPVEIRRRTSNLALIRMGIV